MSSDDGVYAKQYPEIHAVEGMPLGRHVYHDPESRRYVFKAPREAEPLVSVEHKLNIGVLDQGNLGSCVANMATHYLSWDRIYSTLPDDVKTQLNQPYAVQLYRDTTRVDPFPGSWEPDDTGTNGLTVAKVLKTRDKISGYVHTFDVLSALTALQKAPLGIGIAWLENCYYPDANGLISYTGTEYGGHEVLVVGFDATKQLVKIRNSWGPRWGVGGHCFMTVADFARALKNDGDAIIFVPKDQPAPVPAPVPDVPASDVPTNADRALVKAMQPWSTGIISKITKSGKANEAYKVWKNIKKL